MPKKYKVSKKQEVHKLYKGEVELKFDPVSHRYTVNGVQKYGVTGILNIIGKPWLMYWAVNKTLEYIEDNWDIRKSYDEIQKDEMLANAKKNHRRFAGDAAQIGTKVHEWIEMYINGQLGKGKESPMPKNENILLAVNNFLKWVSENDIEWHDSERKVYSRKYDFAGTIDAIATVNGKATAIDFKTSTGIYDEMFLQSAAYAMALKEELGSKFEELWIVRVSKTGKEFEAKKSEKIDEHFKTFLCCLGVYRWQNNRRNEKARATKREKVKSKTIKDTRKK